MLCPNCSETMKSTYYDGQNVSHCSSCGASFFEVNGINRITFDTALKLSEERYRKFLSAKEKACPRDFTPLTAVSNSEAVPSSVILFFCSSCSGIFVYPDDLVKFKKAQGAKIDYYKSWQMPFASLKSVLIVFFIVILSASSFLAIDTIQKGSLYRSEAQDLFKTLSITQSGRYIFISFRTDTAFRAQLILLNRETGERTIKTISAEPKTVHQAVLSDIEDAENLNYRIVLSDAGGKTVETEYKKLVISR